MKCRMGLLTTVFLLGSAAPTVCAQTAAGSPSSQQPTEVTPLELGKPIERELGGDQAHSYSIGLTTGQYLHVVVEQKGIDVLVSLFGPDGKKVTEVDSPNGTQGPEPISVITEAAGIYRLEVRSLDAKSEAGRYQVKVEESRPAKPQDKSRIAAQQAFSEGEQLRNEGSAGSLRKAIDKYQEALLLWRVADDRTKEAETLNNIGFVYDDLGEKQKALDYYNQALPLMRAVGARSGEAETLTNIGFNLQSLGESQKALDFFNQSLLLSRAVGDRRAEAAALNQVSCLQTSTLAVLRREQKDRKPATKLLAVLADPVFARDDERVKLKLNARSDGNSKPEDSITPTPQASGARAALANEQPAESYGSRQLVKEQLAKSAQESNATDTELRIARLPATRREATQIMALIPERQGKLALDFAASRATALSNDLSVYRYVHFATHGLLNSTHPELSGIVFSLVDDKGQPEDGFLRAHEVFNLKLSADLVVLSACQTGLGKEVRGEGLISLTRGFMYAGAPRVVVSLWSVDDEATASLMVGFYKAMLSRKMSPAAALRATQIEVRRQKQNANPYYWAAFTIQGEWR